VIARGGFEHASSNRIARAAGLSVSRVYRHFDSKHDLAAQALTATIDRIVGDNALAFVGVDRATYEQMVLAAGRALCDPAAVPVRRLRLECVLAARHHPEIHAEVRRAFDRAERTVTDRFRTLAPTGSDDALDSARSVWHLVRNFGFGVLALDEAAHVLTPALDVPPVRCTCTMKRRAPSSSPRGRPRRRNPPITEDSLLLPRLLVRRLLQPRGRSGGAPTAAAPSVPACPSGYPAPRPPPRATGRRPSPAWHASASTSWSWSRRSSPR